MPIELHMPLNARKCPACLSIPIRAKHASQCQYEPNMSLNNDYSSKYLSMPIRAQCGLTAIKTQHAFHGPLEPIMPLTGIERIPAFLSIPIRAQHASQCPLVPKMPLKAYKHPIGYHCQRHHSMADRAQCGPQNPL